MAHPDRILLAVPPVEVADQYIDNPVFAFLPALMWAASAQKHRPVQVENALLRGMPLLRTPRGWLVGGEPDPFWNRVADQAQGLVVVQWSSFHRRAGTQLPPSEHRLWQRAKAGELQVVLAEFWHGESRFEPVDESAVAAGLPIEKVLLEDGAARLSQWLEIDAVSGSAPIGREHIQPSTLQSLKLLDPLVRTGAAAGAPQGHGPGSVLRAGGQYWPLLSSLGCSYGCIFCRKPGAAARWQGRAPQVIAAELDAIVKAGGRLVFVLDPIANFDASHFRALLRMLGERKLQAVFPNGLALKHLDAALLQELRAVCGDLVVSVESGEPKTLATLRKPVELGHARSVLEEAARLGFNVSAHYMVGVPGETAQEAARTVALAVELFDRLGVVPSLQNFIPVDSSVTGEFDMGSASGSGSELPGSRRPAPRSPVSGSWLSGRVRSHRDRKVILNVTYACNNHCVFCAVGDRPRLHGMLASQLALLRSAREQGIDLLDLDGGEPTLYPSLFELLDEAKALGYRRISITSNGRRLCYGELCRKLARYEELDLSISLHGPTPELHEQLTRVEGSFHQTLTGIWNASKAGLDVCVNMTAVAANVEHLAETAKVAVQAGAKRIALQRYTPFGMPADGQRPPLERLLLQVDRIRAELPGVALTLVNFAPCEAGRHADLAAADQGKAVRTMQFVDGREVQLADYLGRARVHVAECEQCMLREVCAGMWKEDLEPERETDELVDFIPGLACTVGCKFCAVPADGAGSDLSTQAAVEQLTRLSTRRARSLRFGGGEPTEREDLLSLVRAARELGYKHISVQSSGLKLAEPQAIEALIQSGVSEVRLSIWAASDESYASVTNEKNGYTRFLQALAGCLERLGPRVGVELLAIRPFLPELAATLQRLVDMGLRDAMVWLPGYEGRGAGEGAELVPRMSEAAPVFREALALQERTPGLRVRSIYMPLCLLGDLWERNYDVAHAPVLIAAPGRVMPMSQCAVDLGVQPPKCAGCARRDVCLGIRPGYLQRHGDSEIEPVILP